MKKTILIILGAPGSGKGTRASVLSKILNIEQVATGDIFRENIKNQTQLGTLAKTYMDKGELVPDEVTVDMIKQRLACPDLENGFILDGFPRTINQAYLLDELLKDMNAKLSAVLFLDVADEEIIKRVSGRQICKKCQASFHKIYLPSKVENVCDKCGDELIVRDDDKPQTVKNRLEVFRKNTLPLVDYYTNAEIIYNLEPDVKKDELEAQLRNLLTKIGVI